MVNMLIIVFAVILLVGLLYCEKENNQRGGLTSKSALSTLFIITALVQPHPLSRYSQFVLGGLVLCLGGDVFLALPQRKMFLCGLASFLLAHVFYICGFFSVASASQWTWLGSLIVFVISGWVYLWLKPRLGSMEMPVVLYVIVISIMAVGAWSVLGNSELYRSGRRMVFTGALCFYFSDVFVARDRFLRREFRNRLIGFPMYYIGQFLLAFSVGSLR